MNGQAERFWAELSALHSAAGTPTLERLVKLGRVQVPPLTVSTSTVNEWLTAKSVPSERRTRFFLVLVEFLQSRARPGGGYAVRTPAWWRHLLDEAREDRRAGQVGRPRKADGVTRAAGPVTLPPAPVVFTGRGRELEEVLLALEPETEKRGERRGPVPAVAVVGMGGVGKTALALHAAHQAKSRGWFPGGLLFVDAQGYSHDSERGPDDVVDQLLRAMGTTGRDLPSSWEEKRDAWHLLLNDLSGRGRPLLVVLDNVRSPGRLVELLPPPPHRALLTSRQSLTHVVDRAVRLGPLSAEDAVLLMDDTLRAADSTDERVRRDATDAVRLAHLCGNLPLALRIITALLRDEPDRSLAAQAEELVDARTRLDALAYGDTDGEEGALTVRAVFDVSCRHLTDTQRRAFRLLATIPGPDFSTEVAKVLLDDPRGRRLLAELGRAHLLGPAAPERWSMHDLVRIFAFEQGEKHASEDGLTEAWNRMLAYYGTTAKAAVGHLDPYVYPLAATIFGGARDAVAWLEAERAALVHIAGMGCALDIEGGVHLAQILAVFLDRNGHDGDGVALGAAAVASSRRTGARASEALALNSMGISLRALRRFDEAAEAHEAALAISRDLGDRPGEASALNGLGSVRTGAGRVGDALEAYRGAIRIHRDTGDRHREAGALTNLGGALTLSRRFAEAVEAHTEAAAIYRSTGDLRGEALALNNRGSALRELRRFDDSVKAHRQALDMIRSYGDLHAENLILHNLSGALIEARQLEEAADICAALVELLSASGRRHDEGGALNHLGAALMGLGRSEAAVDALTAAAEIYRETRDQRREAQALNNLGAVLADLRRLDEAVERHAEAADIFGELGDMAGEGAALTNLGAELAEMGRFEEALRILGIAAVVHGGLDDHYGEGVVLHSTGLTLTRMGRADEAADALRASAKKLRSVGFPPGEARSLRDLAAVLVERGRFPEALEALRRAAELAPEVGDCLAEREMLYSWAVSHNGRWRRRQTVERGHLAK